LEARGVTSAEIGKWLGLYLDRPVIDQTGLAGRFDVNLEFTDSLLHPGQAPAPEAPGDISIFTAVREQLGFKLEPGKGPVKVIVIDHLERPSEN
jgi:uncharacterized protein (TIGR03435 family)